ncbi:MAG: hypothetical protein QOJ42_6572 [Acidobacteriaceae bacterium]|nr:hypothetical protein [Acidobacteriaceae bacterium]
MEQLYADLIEMDRMLPACPGVIGIQTLAGALGTGTHGQGLRQSSLGDAALSMKVMLADGQIQLVERDDPRFGAFMLSMGCLGIVLEVSFRTVPNVIMKCRKLTVDQEWLIANHERLNQEHLFVKTWWFAWTGEAHVWLVDPASEFEARAYRAAGCLPLDLGSGAGPAALLDPTVEATMLKMGADTKNEALDGRHIETMRRFKNGNDLIGNVYQLLCKGIPAPQINCEVSVPFDKSVEIFGILRQWQQEHPSVLLILLFCGAAEPPRLGYRRLMANPCAGSAFWCIWRQTANSLVVRLIGCMRCKRAWLASAELRTWASIFLPKSTSFRSAPRGVISTDCARSSIPTGYSKTNSSSDCSPTPSRRPPNDAGASFRSRRHSD